MFFKNTLVGVNRTSEGSDTLDASSLNLIFFVVVVVLGCVCVQEFFR